MWEKCVSENQVWRFLAGMFISLKFLLLMLETDGFMAPDWNLKTGGAYKDLYSCGLKYVQPTYTCVNILYSVK